MHDPLTLAFRVRLPKMLGGVELLEIWHNDPCRGGSDDSCRRAHFSDEAKRAIRGLAQREASEPYYLLKPGRIGTSPETTQALLCSLTMDVARVCGWRLAILSATRFAAEHAQNYRDAFCFEPGWHSTAGQDEKWARRDYMERLIYTVAQSLHFSRRRWWNSYRLHVHHWRIGGPPRRLAKRWIWFLRDRCSMCRRRYSLRDLNTEGAIRHFWDSSIHARCARKEPTCRPN